MNIRNDFIIFYKKIPIIKTGLECHIHHHVVRIQIRVYRIYHTINNNS